MSADAKRCARAHGQVVRPEPVVEKSIIESVSGLINEVAPSSYYLPQSPQQASGDHAEMVQWARFERASVNERLWWTEPSTPSSSDTPPLLLMLGYSNGVQVWSVGSGGLAQEVLSWRQGVARDARLLPSPGAGAHPGDVYGERRPLLALCVAAGTETLFSSVSIVSLRTGEQVRSIKFKSSVSGLLASRRVLVVTFVGKLAVFDARTFEDRFTVTTCYPSPGLEDNPTALGDRWLAYGERRYDVYLESRGGRCSELTSTYTASVFHAAKSITKGLRELSEGLACKFSSSGGTQFPAGAVVGGCVLPNHATPAGVSPPGGCQGGLVTVLDVDTAGAAAGETELEEDGRTTTRDSTRGVIAHFQAHTMPLVHLCFDRSGTLLLTADKSGHSFHVFRVEPHPLRPALASVHHLYTLYRGDTTAKVVDMAFSGDSRWVSVATHRGTTHLFPICPYGGVITARTHCGPRVVNKISRFHKSAGFQEDSHCSGRVSPIQRQRCSSGMAASVLVPPLAQLRQPILSQLTTTGGPVAGRVSVSASGDDPGHVRVVSTFAASRGWSVPPAVASSLAAPPVSSSSCLSSRERRSVDSLYVFNCNSATLIEYHVQPRATAFVAQDKVPQDSPIEVGVHAHARWSLARQSVWSELRPPLSTLNPLLATPYSECADSASDTALSDADSAIEHWVSQVEILTHAGPHRRLWMGPQFSFRPYTSSGSDDVTETRDLLVSVQASPLNVPAQLASLSIECGSASSVNESCPRLVDSAECSSSLVDGCRPSTIDLVTSQALQIQLADAMADTPTPTEHCSSSPPPVEPLLTISASSSHGAETVARGRLVDSPPSSASSSSVDVRSSPERASSPLDFSIYTQSPASSLKQEVLAEQGWGDDIILASDSWAGGRAPLLESGGAVEPSDEDQKPTPSTKRRGKKKRK